MCIAATFSMAVRGIHFHMKILTIIGARPQFIKASTVSRVIATHDDIQEIIVHTGQHYDSNMSNIFFNELEIPQPNYNLGIGGVGHAAMTGRQLEALEKVMLAEKPDWVLVYGDTNSTLAGALAAVKLHLPVAHVEAGLRSFNRRMPEEINRILTDHASERLFAPTETAIVNLKREGIPNERLELVGDVMFDAALFYRKRARRPVWFDSLQLGKEAYILATIHRAENTDNPKLLTAILTGLGDAGKPVILPLHPRTCSQIKKYTLSLPSNMHITEPVGYLEMVWLEMNAEMIATDSGGVQKEAYFHAKPCVTLRNETEWVELVDAGWNTLAGTDPVKIGSALQRKNVKYKILYYGDGRAAEKIITGLVNS